MNSVGGASARHGSARHDSARWGSARWGSARWASGFTLLEIAIVLAVMGLLLQNLLVPFGARYQENLRRETVDEMQQVMDALIGFATANHRLPCPATATTQGREIKTCQGSSARGYVPAVSLGLQGRLNEQGLLLDSWGRPIIYAVGASDHSERGERGKPDFTSINEMQRVGLRYLQSDIVVCRTGARNECPWQSVLANQIPFLLVSTGRDHSNGLNEAENQDRDSTFVNLPYSENPASRFDDIVLWISENRLFYELIKAGVLP